jgi:hypothetical protein
LLAGGDLKKVINNITHLYLYISKGFSRKKAFFAVTWDFLHFPVQQSNKILIYYYSISYMINSVGRCWTLLVVVGLLDCWTGFVCSATAVFSVFFFFLPFFPVFACVKLFCREFA